MTRHEWFDKLKIRWSCPSSIPSVRLIWEEMLWKLAKLPEVFERIWDEEENPSLTISRRMSMDHLHNIENRMLRELLLGTSPDLEAIAKSVFHPTGSFSARLLRPDIVTRMRDKICEHFSDKLFESILDDEELFDFFGEDDEK